MSRRLDYAIFILCFFGMGAAAVNANVGALGAWLVAALGYARLLFLPHPGASKP